MAPADRKVRPIFHDSVAFASARASRSSSSGLGVGAAQREHEPSPEEILLQIDRDEVGGLDSGRPRRAGRILATFGIVPAAVRGGGMQPRGARQRTGVLQLAQPHRVGAGLPFDVAVLAARAQATEPEEEAGGSGRRVGNGAGIEARAHLRLDRRVAGIGRQALVEELQAAVHAGVARAQPEAAAGERVRGGEVVAPRQGELGGQGENLDLERVDQGRNDVVHPLGQADLFERRHRRADEEDDRGRFDVLLQERERARNGDCRVGLARPRRCARCCRARCDRSSIPGGAGRAESPCRRRRTS